MDNTVGCAEFNIEEGDPDKFIVFAVRSTKTGITELRIKRRDEQIHSERYHKRQKILHNTTDGNSFLSRAIIGVAIIILFAFVGLGLGLIAILYTRDQMYP